MLETLTTATMWTECLVYSRPQANLVSSNPHRKDYVRTWKETRDEEGKLDSWLRPSLPVDSALNY